MLVNYTISELKASGVYCILPPESGGRYVGSTTNFHFRMLTHRSTLDKGTHDNKLLQEAWNQLGRESFSFEILELTDDLINREQYWMDYYQVLNPDRGFTAHKPIYTNPNRKIPVRERHLPNTYYLTSPEGKEYVVENLAQFCRDYNLHQGHLRAVLKGTGFYKGWKGKVISNKGNHSH